VRPTARCLPSTCVPLLPPMRPNALEGEGRRDVTCLLPLPQLHPHPAPAGHRPRAICCPPVNTCCLPALLVLPVPPTLLCHCVRGRGLRCSSGISSCRRRSDGNRDRSTYRSFCDFSCCSPITCELRVLKPSKLYGLKLATEFIRSRFNLVSL